MVEKLLSFRFCFFYFCCFLRLKLNKYNKLSCYEIKKEDFHYYFLYSRRIYAWASASTYHYIMLNSQFSLLHIHTYIQTNIYASLKLRWNCFSSKWLTQQLEKSTHEPPPTTTHPLALSFNLMEIRALRRISQRMTITHTYAKREHIIQPRRYYFLLQKVLKSF